MEICLAGYCNHIDSLTKNKAYIGNGASSPPVMAAMVPSEKVVTMAKSKAATGELSTAGNCRAVNMEPEIRAASTRRTVCSRCCNAKQCELTCLYKLLKQWGGDVGEWTWCTYQVVNDANYNGHHACHQRCEESRSEQRLAQPLAVACI